MGDKTGAAGELRRAEGLGRRAEIRTVRLSRMSKAQAPAVSLSSASLRVKRPLRPAVRPEQALTPPIETLACRARSIRASDVAWAGIARA
ncbi:hypothetical protein [Phenylobacterium aquaticum]|uniref:hypothetical protein n=1 Tax=Phenylobacterium aquaticum TaxID=1763816 RepID=UPI0026ECC66B|nr:hypothetical protein [Phenylobacterium aquaticum]